MSEIAIGSHLITSRTGYQHHGLFTENGQVIHLTSNNLIEEISLEKFTEGRSYRIKKYHSQFSRREIINRARSRLGSENYSLLFNNCEHFVTWCIYGQAESKQVQQGVSLGVITPPAIMTAITANTPTLAGLTMAEITTLSTGGTLASSVTGITLLSTTPIIPAAIVGYGVFKAIQFLNK